MHAQRGLIGVDPRHRLIAAFNLDAEIAFAGHVVVQFLGRDRREHHQRRDIARDAGGGVADGGRAAHAKADAVVLAPEVIMGIGVVAHGVGLIARPLKLHIAIGLGAGVAVGAAATGSRHAAAIVTAAAGCGRQAGDAGQIRLHHAQVLGFDLQLGADHVVLGDFALLPVAGEHFAGVEVRQLEPDIGEVGGVVAGQPVIGRGTGAVADFPVATDPVIAVGGKHFIQLVLVRRVAFPQHRLAVEARGGGAVDNRRAQRRPYRLQVGAGEVDPAKVDLRRVRVKHGDAVVDPSARGLSRGKQAECQRQQQ